MHFTCAVSLSVNRWVYVDDLSQKKLYFCDVNEIYRSYRSGWFFVIYILSGHTNHQPSESQTEPLYDFIVNNKNSKCTKRKTEELKTYALRSNKDRGDNCDINKQNFKKKETKIGL